MNGFVCQCEEGFEGDFCDQPIDYCSNSPCIAGICNNNRRNFSCSCPPHLSGTLCDQPVNCNAQPCQRGICTDVNTSTVATPSYECLCPLGWSGVNCDKKESCAEDLELMFNVTKAMCLLIDTVSDHQCQLLLLQPWLKKCAERRKCYSLEELTCDLKMIAVTETDHNCDTKLPSAISSMQYSCNSTSCMIIHNQKWGAVNKEPVYFCVDITEENAEKRTEISNPSFLVCLNNHPHLS